MNINAISGKVIDAVFHVHNELGPGLFESVYEEILCYELQKRELVIRRQQIIPLQYRGEILSDCAFKADVIVNNAIILELKSIDQLAPVHFKQLLTYLRLTHMKLGLLINFNEVLIKQGIHRIVNNL